MTFLGPVTTLEGHLVRPHDIEVFTHAGIAGSRPGTIRRLVRVGFEVRLAVEPIEGGDEVLVTVTRATQRHLGLEEGSQVWLARTQGAPAVPVMSAV